MAYSHQRLRKTLAVVRVFAGVLLIVSGGYKLFSPEFSGVDFPHSILAYVNGQAVGWYPTSALMLVWRHAAMFATATGLIEVLLGFALLLGLAVRPLAVAAMLYEFNFVLASWNQTGSFATNLDAAASRLMLIALMALFAVGHAGETWGIGSLYHAGRSRLWRSEVPAAMEIAPRPPALVEDEYNAEEAFPDMEDSGAYSPEVEEKRS